VWGDRHMLWLILCINTGVQFAEDLRVAALVAHELAVFYCISAMYWEKPTEQAQRMMLLNVRALYCDYSAQSVIDAATCPPTSASGSGYTAA